MSVNKKSTLSLSSLYLQHSFEIELVEKTCNQKEVVVVNELPCGMCIFLWKALQNEKHFHIKHLSVKIAKILTFKNCNSPLFQISEEKCWTFQKKGHFDCIIKDFWGGFKYRQWLETRFCARNNRCSDLHVLTIELTSHNLSSMDLLLHHISCNNIAITLVSFSFRYF